MQRMDKRAAVFSIAIAELVGILSSLLAGDIRSVYQSLYQPPLSPPSWVFPVVWVLLFAAMGLAAAIVATSRSARQQERSSALVLYGAQLFVNFLWPIFFFRWELFWLSFLFILLLDGLVILTIRAFGKVEKSAAALLYPYLAWLLFATYLNLGVAILN